MHAAPSELIVDGSGTASWRGRLIKCAIGRGGIVAEKREGDGGTPAGIWPMRAVLYRPDRVAPPDTALPRRPLAPADGWCDDPAASAYNRLVHLPYPGHCEALWLDDAVYDVVVPLGYNDDPVVAGLGSAIFLHVARPDFTPTAGCVALALEDLLPLLREASPATQVRVIRRRVS